MAERIELYKERYLERLAICSEQKDIPELHAVRTASEEVSAMMKEDGETDIFGMLCQIRKEIQNSC